jgi:hypothetical protein
MDENEELGLPTARKESAEYDAAYDARPLDEPDAWGDLASFLEALAASRPPASSW